MPKIIPHLWFDSRAEEAANFYVSVFKNSKILSVSHYPNAGQEITGQEAGKVMTVEFELDGNPFMALNGGPLFKFNESISFMINVDGQEEHDYYFDKLSAVRESEQCGWVKDKFGVSWQVVPRQLGELMSDPNPAKAEATMKAMLQMKKLDIAALEKAYKG